MNKEDILNHIDRIMNELIVLRSKVDELKVINLITNTNTDTHSIVKELEKPLAQQEIGTDINSQNEYNKLRENGMIGGGNDILKKYYEKSH